MPTTVHQRECMLPSLIGSGLYRTITLALVCSKILVSMAYAIRHGHHLRLWARKLLHEWCHMVYWLCLKKYGQNMSRMGVQLSLISHEINAGCDTQHLHLALACWSSTCERMLFFMSSCCLRTCSCCSLSPPPPPCEQTTNTRPVTTLSS